MNTNPYPQRVGEPDCRDYLRTGRCKYGESCKYHHPPNVQSGGGIRTPLDPNEPPFPIRPSEPPCQYFLKHGTCKFGQACKFHHPPHILASGSSQPAAVPSAFMTSVGGVSGQQHIMLNAHSSEGDFQPQSSMLQMLPQRPNEQDCLYFLKNGRCRYGATCKYHHPLSSTPIRQVESSSFGRQQQVRVQFSTQSSPARGRSVSTGSISDVGSSSTAQFVPQRATNDPNFRHHPDQTTAGATHVLLTDGPIAVMTVNQVPGSHYGLGGFLSNTNGQFLRGGNVESGAMSTSQTEQSSPILSSVVTSTSSIASSYDTTSSSIDMLMSSVHGPQQIPQPESPRGLWNRPPQKQQQAPFSMQGHRSVSGMSLRNSDTLSEHHHFPSSRLTLGRSNNSFEKDTSSIIRPTIADINPTQQEHSFQSGNIESFRETAALYHRSESQFSRDGIMANWGRASSESAQALWRANQVDKRDVIVRQKAEDIIFPRESTTHLQPDQHASSKGGCKDGTVQPKKATPAVDDDGLNLMTSALLNMLDTHDTTNQPHRKDERARSSSAPSTPHHAGISNLENVPESLPAIPGPRHNYRYPGMRHDTSPDIHAANDFGFQQSTPTSKVLVGNTNGMDVVTNKGGDCGASAWTPTWQKRNSTSQQLEQNAQSVSILRWAQQPPTT